MSSGFLEVDALLMALLRACQYSLVGIGFAMLIANTRIVNFAHGYLMLFACWIVTLLMKASFFGADVAGVIFVILLLMVLLGAGLQRLYGLFDRGSDTTYADRILIGTVGVGFVLEGLVSVMTNGQALRFPNLEGTQDRSLGWAALMSLALLALMFLDRRISAAARLPGPFCTGLLADAPPRYYGLTLAAVPALLGLIAFAVLEAGRVLTPAIQRAFADSTRIRWDHARLPLLLLTLAFLGVTSVLLRTRAGLLVRACNADGRLATRLGFSPRRVERLVFVYSACVAGIGAIFVGLNSNSVRLSFGFRWTLLGFCCALAAGRLGRLSMAGVAVSALLLGLIEYACGRWSPDTKVWEAVGFLVLSLVLLASRGEFSWRARFAQ
ncbi:MAG TPA: hypothetical protein VF179_16975 [Thermoanaerobaculia bacterium]|nr:hypothetical protein [Thermoanaerobaculia bacterium]